MTQIYSQVVERYARLFERPEARLRFLNNTLAKQATRQEELRQSLHRFRFLENTRFYDWIVEARLYSSILEEMRTLMTTVPAYQRDHIRKIEVPFKARVLFFCYRARRAFYGAGLLLACLALFGLYSLTMWSGRKVNDYLAQRSGKTTVIVKEVSRPDSTSGLEQLPNFKPEKVWSVEKTDKYERYSNGGRIVTSYEIDNRPRGYYLIPRGSDALGGELRRAPVGVVYHTSESHMVDFFAENTDSLQKSSQWLVEFIQGKKAYNYLIDRFGEIYRIVRDDQAANHAGNSIWADEKYVYVGLNDSFIGICFESTTTAGSLEETLTEAQMVSGRLLTAIVRGKYNIEDVNCTTHGLVSINPERGVIAFHHDWVRNFPFKLMGLSDKYKVPPPNMTDYGFTYDDEILQKLEQKLWDGALQAEEEFKQRAEKLKTNPDLLRLKLRARYNDQYARVRALRTSPAESAKLAKSQAAGDESSETGGVRN